MKTKNLSPIPFPVPTCGEVFHFLVMVLDITSWQDAFRDSGEKMRVPKPVARTSDRLSDWAYEVDGRVPKVSDFFEFIKEHIDSIEILQSAELLEVLSEFWIDLIGAHKRVVLSEVSYLDREGTRRLYATRQAIHFLAFLWAFQHTLRHLDSTKGPLLSRPLDEMVREVWSVPSANSAKRYPLHALCYDYFEDFRRGHSPVDVRTCREWQKGLSRPSMELLGLHFDFLSPQEKLGMVLNFSFAGLIGALVDKAKEWISPSPQGRIPEVLLGQLYLIQTKLSQLLEKRLSSYSKISGGTIARIALGIRNEQYEFYRWLNENPDVLRDPGFAPYRLFFGYQKDVADHLPLPDTFGAFWKILARLWEDTDLSAPSLCRDYEVTENQLSEGFPQFSEVFSGFFHAMRARRALARDVLSRESLETALTEYEKAFSAVKYSAGPFTEKILREALGFTAVLHRRGLGEGSLRPKIKKMLDWWDLLGFGDDFDHEQFDQRVERAEELFTDELHLGIRNRLRSSFPEMGLYHQNQTGFPVIADYEYISSLKEKPLNKRQQKPLKQTLTGRDQSPLMEAIDREDFIYARELIQKGADLNFINSTGETCLTKAIGHKDFDLALQILQRLENPICTETILRITEKFRTSGLAEILESGQVELLREIAKPSTSRKAIDLSRERILDQTPLYFCVGVLVTINQTLDQVRQRVNSGQLPDSKAMRQLSSLMSTRQPGNDDERIFEELRSALNIEAVIPKILQCVDFLIDEAKVDLDACHINGHCALTLASEVGLLDVVSKLLEAGANVNHRVCSGATALDYAKQRRDLKMICLLKKFGALYLD
jgi:hypothetical protein